MSALARYFLKRGVSVSGYDRVPSPLTSELEQEGASIVYEDHPQLLNQEVDLVIYTPAIPHNHQILSWYKEHKYPLLKRSEVLELITKDKFVLSIAGSHGKTTVTTMIAHLLRVGQVGHQAFLGGISVNYDNNYWDLGQDDKVVVEADEYDRSFLRLVPNIAVLTSMDPDHLDVYGSTEALEEAYIQYTEKIKPGGSLWYKHGLPKGSLLKATHKHTYSLQNDMADVYADNIRMEEGGYHFDWKSQEGLVMEGLYLNMGGMHNVENAVVAIGVALEAGVEEEAIREGISSFKGVQRRFEYLIKTPDLVYIDDYAHHPKELEALTYSAHLLFPKKKLTVAFQPHLYSRTRDLVAGFGRALSHADEVIILPIYPAREEAIPGITSEWLKEQMGLPVCTVLGKEGLLEFVERASLEVFVTAGAGDISRLVQPIKERLEVKMKKN